MRSRDGALPLRDLVIFAVLAGVGMAASAWGQSAPSARGEELCRQQLASAHARSDAVERDAVMQLEKMNAEAAKGAALAKWVDGWFGKPGG